MDIVEQQPCNSNIDNDIENKHNNNSFLLELMSTVQNYSQCEISQPKVIEIYLKKQSWRNIALQL